MLKAIRALGRQAKAPLNNQRGIALMMAMACIMLILYFAMEVSYDSNVEYIVNSQNLNRVKAYYAAKSGMQLSLLRIKIYQQASTKFASMLGSNSALLQEIWRFPFAWPLPIPPELNAVDKESFTDATKESMMDASYLVTIEDEGSKIDLNDLNSPSKALRESTKNQLLGIFQQKIKEDEVFARAYGQTRFDELINSIQDWMTPRATSGNGGSKQALYNQVNQAAQTDYYPPNRAFRTLGELHMIPGMIDVFYELLEPRVTIYGMKGINPNLATKEVLKSLDVGMTDEVVAEVIKRRDDTNLGGPYKDAADFWTFVQQKGARLEGKTEEVPLIFESATNFKIRSTGEFAGATREIIAMVMDLNKTATKVKAMVDKEKAAANPGASPSPSPSPSPGGGAKTPTAPTKGPPRIVYWNER